MATLAAEAQPFVSDPSNRNPAFARARLREARQPSAADALAGDIRRLGRERAMREQARDALLARAVALHPAGFAVLDRAALLSAPPDVAERALSALVMALGGGRYPPRRRAVAHLLRVLGGEARGGYVLGGCQFVQVARPHSRAARARGRRRARCWSARGRDPLGSPLRGRCRCRSRRHDPRLSRSGRGDRTGCTCGRSWRRAILCRR